MRFDSEEILLGLGAAHTSYQPEGFAINSVSVQIRALFELARLGASLNGSFVRFNTGLAYQRGTQDGAASSTFDRLLLGGFGFGLRLPRNIVGEFFYNHRRDTLAGGTSPGPNQGSGFLGFFGTRFNVPLTQRFAMTSVFRIGSGRVLSVLLEYRSKEKNENETYK